ncbi:MAG: tRNA pseudouridine(55) synthase TruB [Spirochaetales bacterium]|nr:tRNA pseudouridine(55) synthase TruB [Spirochaetales bacterium]
MNNKKSGLVLLHKPEGVTSFHALDEIKKRLQLKKVGHTGTLDKFASGLLLVLTGKYTRLTPLFVHLNKEYVTRIRFGIQTDTLDPEGKVVKEGHIPDPESIDRVLSHFTGEIEQAPPRFSAIHLDGERVYKKALRGETIRLPERKVTIFILKQLSYEPPDLTLYIRCSGGTYIRALARDIGNAAGSCAYLTHLTRTKVGNFNLSNAVLPLKFDPEKDIIFPGAFIPLLDNLKVIHIREDYYSEIIKGASLQKIFFPGDLEEDGTYAIFKDISLIALIEKTENKYAYRMVFGSS